ncbi:MAG TPA: hypothetical protein VFZ34_21295 [Blastocatellia bacterium]|nr:hypothetical protein [Blastocatellia bacterium]
MQFTITNDTLRKVNSLSNEKRAKVLQIVQRHLKACAKNGCPTESMDRVYLEAIDVAEMETKFPEPKKEIFRQWEVRHYDQYISPKAA